MKNKALTVILACALICFVGLSIFLLWNLQETRKQVTVFSDRVICADEQLNSLQEQLTDLEDLREQVADLNSQLETSRSQVKALENTLSENNAQIASLENTIGENNATIAALEEQLAEAQRKQQANTGNSSNGNSNPSSNNRITPINPMPQGTDPAGRNGSGIGDGNGAGNAPPGVHYE